MTFHLTSTMKPSGDQPLAIKKMVQNLKNEQAKQVLMGVTGSGKTFSIANVIQQTSLPTLVISHNKTLAGQLYQEFKELFPQDRVSYFVSYYDYYQPEAYLPSTDTYIAKEVEINDLIDKLRLETTSNIFSGDNNIVIASVSCIYNIGDPIEFSGKTLDFKIGQKYPRRQLLENLISLFYLRSELEFKRGSFRIRGEQFELWPAYQDWMVHLDFENEILKTIIFRHPFTGHEINENMFTLYPAKQYVGGGGDDKKEIYQSILNDTQKQIEMFKSQNRLLEANRIQQRVEYDLEMLTETGYINGIENYSIYFEKNRSPGDPPYTLVDYFKHRWGDNFLTVIDESHVTIPQIKGMYFGDIARKKTLVDFGFRLPSAFDNRPLKFEEFNQRTPKVIYVSATPSPFEIEQSGNVVVEQIIRPTGLIDPSIEVRPANGQITDILKEIKSRIQKKQRVLLITLTKRMSEDLSGYLSDVNNTGIPIKVAYLHSDIDTLERTEILDKLRSGDYDVLVGVNLLREGLDLPEVSLVAILDAGQQGFLRSRASLIQIMGRASRHIAGQVILYSDITSPAMKQAIEEVRRRRKIQLKYNQENNITPQSIVKSIRPKIIEYVGTDRDQPSLDQVDPLSLTPPQRQKHLTALRKQMKSYAADLNFEQAIKIRDLILNIEKI